MNSSHPLRRPLLPLMCTTLAPTCQTCPILLHRLSRLFSCFHNHLLNKALFRISNFLIPKPPNFLSMHTVFQPSRCNFLPSTSTSPKRSLCNFSNLVLTFLRILKRHEAFGWTWEDALNVTSSSPLRQVLLDPWGQSSIRPLLYLISYSTRLMRSSWSQSKIGGREGLNPASKQICQPIHLVYFTSKHLLTFLQVSFQSWHEFKAKQHPFPIS